ncbi:MAG: hypothetical protein ABIC04_02795 [Nanoarchaeota archaeon]
MQAKEIINRIENDEKFKEWKKENYASSLVHIFKMFDEANKDEWQVGFYNPDDTITTFVLLPEGIKIIPPVEIFKKPDAKVLKLTIEDVKIEMDNALLTAKKFQEKEYPREIATKEMVILQKLELGQVYNVTFVTHAFNTLNIKIDSRSGEVLKHELISLTDLKAN